MDYLVNCQICFLQSFQLFIVMTKLALFYENMLKRPQFLSLKLKQPLLVKQRLFIFFFKISPPSGNTGGF